MTSLGIIANGSCRYILELQQKIARIEQNEKGQASPYSANFETHITG